MAIIQVLKPPIRVAFHRRQIARWLADSKNCSVSVDEFLGRVSKRRHNALLALPIEQLAAQIQVASEGALALSNPTDWFIQSLVDKPDKPDEKPEISAASDDNCMIKTRDRSQLSFIVQRRIDALQIQVRYSWRRLIRVLSLAVSVILTLVVAIIFSLWQQNFVGTAFLVLLLSALGGFFASVARDVVAIVERLRN